MNIGRPTEFDRKEALSKAMELFWSQGYESTGLTELTQQMGIGRQSLYNAFGDKHALFVAAFEQYVSDKTEPLVSQLRAPGSPLGNIRKVFDSVVEFVVAGDCRGCLVTNSIVELAPNDSAVRTLVTSVVKRLEQAFRDTLDRAAAVGEIAAGSDTLAMARFLNGTLHGLLVLGKVSSRRALLLDVVNVAMTAIR